MNTTTLNTLDSTLDSSIKDYFTLLKPGVLSLVVFSGAVGLFLAPGSLHPLASFLTVVCIAMGSGAGGAINMWYDRDIDAIMKRTSTRPIPAGRIAPDDGLALGLFLALFSVLILGMATNWWAAGLLAFAIYFYSVTYTMRLKRSTPQKYCYRRSCRGISTSDWLVSGDA